MSGMRKATGLPVKASTLMNLCFSPWKMGVGGTLLFATLLMGIVGGAWAADFSSWAYYRTITIANPGLTANVTGGFPVLVRLNGKIGNGGNADDSMVFANASSTSGWDIRFTTSSATDSIPFQIARYDNANMYAEFWVLVGTVNNASSTTFRMYFGKSGLTATPSNPAAVFPASQKYAAVYHLNEQSGTTYSDAGPYGINLTKNGTVTPTSGGIIGYSQTFNGSSGYLSNTAIPNSRINFRYLFTISGWFNLGSANGGGFIEKSDGDASWEANEVNFFFGNGTNGGSQTGTVPCMVGYGRGWINTSFTIGTGAWHHIAYVYNSTGPVRQVYIDGSLTTPGQNDFSPSANDPGAVLWLGHVADNDVQNQYFTGQMAEVRFDSAQRSADWIKLCYQTQKAASTVINTPPGQPSLSGPSSGSTDQVINNLSISWGAVSLATSYSLQVSTASDFLTTVTNQPSLTGTSLLLSGLANSTTYYWEVNASNAAGPGMWSSVWTFSTMTLPPPGVPSLVSPTNGAFIGAITAAALSWNTTTGALSYRLQASLSSTFSPVIFDQNGISETSLAVSGIPLGAKVYWHVNAYNASGTSVWSNLWSFTASPSATLPQQVAVYSQRISFSKSGITYELPTSSSVSIVLYDMQGRQVRQLANATQSAGSYSINFNSARLTTGYYIVEFKAGSFSMQKKFALMN